MKNYLLMVGLLTSTSLFAQDSITIKKPAIYFDLHAGTGMRLGKEAPSDNSMMNNHVAQLKNGFQFDVALFIEVAPQHLVGVKYNSWNKKGGLRAGSSSMTSDLTLSFYGFGYMFAQHGTENSQWNVDAGVGYMTYRDRAVMGAEDVDIKGNTIGGYIGAAYYFKIINGLYFGPRINLLVGGVKKFQVKGEGQFEEIELESPESLTRLDISLGLRIKL